MTGDRGDFRHRRPGEMHDRSAPQVHVEKTTVDDAGEEVYEISNVLGLHKVIAAA
jgi:hypothetical protein